MITPVRRRRAGSTARLVPRIAMALLMGLCGLAVTSVTAGARAAAAPGVTCLFPHPGLKVPVLLVHGFESTRKTWGLLSDPNSTLASLNATNRIDAAAFAYGNATKEATDKSLSDQWVTNPAIGHALAQQIVCAADASKSQGGIGKVVLVGHSMGGLAIRCAINATCNDGGQGSLGDLSGDVADVITFGTPSTGSFLRGGAGRSAAETAVAKLLPSVCTLMLTQPQTASTGALCLLMRNIIYQFGASPAAVAFAEGSPQLGKLNSYTSSVPVLAVAGKVAVTTSIGTLWHRTLAGSAGDLVVSASSAQGWEHADGQLGGTDTEDCGTLDLSASAAALASPLGAYLFVKNLLAGLACSHLDETNNPEFAVQIVKQIEHLHRGQWTDPTLTITGTSLGAVSTSDTLAQAIAASGVQIFASGDGQYRTSIPNIFAAGVVRCIGVGDPNNGGPLVATIAGFHTGQTIAKLQHLYGTRVHYTPGRRVTVGGYYEAGTVLDSGWWIADNGGYLLFSTKDGTANTPVEHIYAQPTQPPTAPGGCGPAS